MIPSLFGPKRALQLCCKSISLSATRFDCGPGLRLVSSTASSVQTLLRDLRQLDTSSLCDAEKTLANSHERKGENGDISGIQLMNDTIRPMNHLKGKTYASAVMAGVARTVKFTEPNDFLPVMRALALDAQPDEVLVVDTLSSTRAVAGEIFVAEARRKGLAGMVVDGPIRDTTHLDPDHSEDDPTPTAMRLYATSVTPHSGTTQSPGKMQPSVVNCGGIEVRPGDLVVGDQDGVLAGDVASFSVLVPIAQTIQQIESELMDRITSTSPSSGENTLESMTNLDEHVQRRLEGKDSALEFRT